MTLLILDAENKFIIILVQLIIVFKLITLLTKWLPSYESIHTSIHAYTHTHKTTMIEFNKSLV